MIRVYMWRMHAATAKPNQRREIARDPPNDQKKNAMISKQGDRVPLSNKKQKKQGSIIHRAHIVQAHGRARARLYSYRRKTSTAQRDPNTAGKRQSSTRTSDSQRAATIHIRLHDLSASPSTEDNTHTAPLRHTHAYAYKSCRQPEPQPIVHTPAVLSFELENNAADNKRGKGHADVVVSDQPWRKQFYRRAGKGHHGGAHCCLRGLDLEGTCARAQKEPTVGARLLVTEQS